VRPDVQQLVKVIILDEHEHTIVLSVMNLGMVGMSLK